MKKYLQLIDVQWKNILGARKAEFHQSKALLALLGFVFSVVAFYPGFMSADSLDQYNQSHTLKFNDWHPPIMAWLWSKLNLVIDGPQSLLFLQLSMLWGGLFLLCRNLSGGRFTILCILVGFFPWIINFQGVLWKDMGMAFSLLLALAILTTNKLTNYKLVAASFLLLYAFMLRGNAPAAVLPIVWFALWKTFPMQSNRIRLLATVLILMLMFVFSYVFTYKVLDTYKAHPEIFILTDDLVHLSVSSNRSLLPKAQLELLKECKDETIAGGKEVGKMSCLIIKSSYGKAISYEVLTGIDKKAWISAVVSNPLEYLKFRLDAYMFLLRSPSVSPYYVWQPGINPNDVGLKHDDNAATKILEQYVSKAVQLVPFFFKPYWWLISALLIMAGTFVLQGSRGSIILIRGLLTSAILYMLSYIPLTPAADFRYVYWSVLAISLAGMVFVTSDLKFGKWKTEFAV